VSASCPTTFGKSFSKSVFKQERILRDYLLAETRNSVVAILDRKPLKMFSQATIVSDVVLLQIRMWPQNGTALAVTVDDDDDAFIYPDPSPKRYAGYNNYIYLIMYM
jgi:hypothetical protein